MNGSRRPGELELSDRRYTLRSWQADTVFSAQELIEIAHALNQWEWDERLGEKPSGWDALPPYQRKRLFGRRKDRYSIITPIMREIDQYIPSYYALRYHHQVTFGSTQEEFDKWWIRERLAR